MNTATKQIRTVDDIKQLGTILSVWAHPDDESFLAAGVIVAARQNGQRVICVTATKGEAGSQDEQRWPKSTLGEVRAKELASALEILGVSKHYWLGCQDGSCAVAPFNDEVNKLAKIIAHEKPDSIITFGPDGWTGHADHSAVSKWVREVVAQQSLQIPVYHVVGTPEYYEEYLKEADEKLNIFFNIDQPPLLPAEQCDIYFELPEAISHKKYEALAAMPSQTEAMFAYFEPKKLEKVWALECFCNSSRDVSKQTSTAPS